MPVEFLVGETVTIRGQVLDNYRNVALDGESGSVTVKLGEAVKVQDGPMTKVDTGVFEYYFTPDEPGVYEATVSIVVQDKVLKERSYFRVVE